MNLKNTETAYTQFAGQDELKSIEGCFYLKAVFDEKLNPGQS